MASTQVDLIVIGAGPAGVLVTLCTADLSTLTTSELT